MDILKERIISDGVAVGTEILKVDSFLNHQIDVKLFEQIGDEFRRRFSDIERSVDKILTVEASGIAVAAFTSRYFGYPPVVFAKKESVNTMDEDYYFSEVMSFTRRKLSSVRIAKKYLRAGERVLIIDDFLAHGQAALGLVNLVAQAEAEILGVGIVIEKEFQGGSRKLRKKGFRVESLAIVERIEDEQIVFKKDSEVGDIGNYSREGE
ncbi:MAG: xanthine phosphoribosyltransferase [Clostridiales Family XIII bacterium]|jgi:xanthine phosphoribosyltransferase|nr:xanthine phosphoribosyltransferase [Clostridiales Family XIII bacterium]